MIIFRMRFSFAVVLVLTCFLSHSAVGVQNASPSPTPPPAPPTNVPVVVTPNQPAASPSPNPQAGGSGAASNQPSGGQAQPQNPPVNPRLAQASQTIRPTRAPAPQPTPDPGPNSYTLDWTTGSSTPETINRSGPSTLRIINVNDILYFYSVKVTRITQPDNDLSQWKDLVQSTIDALTPPTNKSGPGSACSLSSKLATERELLRTITDKLDQMRPKASGSKKCPTVGVRKTIGDWNDLRAQYDQFESGLAEVQAQIKDQACQSDPELDHAVTLIVDDFPKLQQKVTAIQQKIDGPHIQDVPYDLRRTSDYDIAVVENCSDGPTDHDAVTFHLKHAFDILTLSGGFLMTKLQARSYSVVASPLAPPPGSAPGTAPTAQNVLSVDGFGSGMRGALVALFNYHDPFEWFGNRPNFGMALSAGPVFDVSQGKADTSKFGVFVGGSVHLWNRLFITPGVHFGEFADFPQGFHSAGDPVPANFGTPTPTKRWTGHFALGITFKGKDLSGLAPGSNNAGSGASTPQSSQ